MVCHTRSKDRGGVLRLPLEEGGSVIVKVWRIRNLKERIKSVAHLSNGWREWCLHRFIFKAGIQVPEPLAFHRLSVPYKGRYEIMAIEDLGEIEQGLPRLKKLLLAKDGSRVSSFEENLIDITATFIKLNIVDIDHQLNNFVVDQSNRLMRLDFECARRHRLGIIRKSTYIEMISRLLASHIYAVQPDVTRSELFAERLYKRLGLDHQFRAKVQTSVNKKLENQSRSSGTLTTVSLPD